MELGTSIGDAEGDPGTVQRRNTNPRKSMILIWTRRMQWKGEYCEGDEIGLGEEGYCSASEVLFIGEEDVMGESES